MSETKRITVSQSVDPNTVLMDIHEAYRCRIGVLVTRQEAEVLCDDLRRVLGDSPKVPTPSDKVAIFPQADEQPMTVKIGNWNARTEP